MKAIICDICGANIEKESLYERYSLWMRDSTYNSFWPQRKDICHDCLEKLKTAVKIKTIEPKNTYIDIEPIPVPFPRHEDPQDEASTDKVI